MATVEMEELLAKHRKEKRELQSRITQKKKNATKKTRKGVNDDCERLERELAEKQQLEIDALEPKDPEQQQEQLEAAVNGLEIHDGHEPVGGETSDAQADVQQSNAGTPTTDISSENQPATRKKPNRQKARLARRAAEQEAQAAAAALEAESLPDLREQEMSAMKKQLETRGLTEIMIRPDGHCLFSACAQNIDREAVLKSGPKPEPYLNVRFAAAEFMARHPDDFEAFLEEPLDAYVRKMRDTAEWGGQLELQAIARSYHVDINVLQSDGRVEKISSGSSQEDSIDPIWLAYYRHSFGLGEHYNALRKKVDAT